MANLASGVLLKLLGEMNMENEPEQRKPSLLQIRSIIPVMAEDDLWPNQGFYLKVSDSSHATFVSLPQEEDEMVLSNKLQIGQLIYVEKLESTHLVPKIRGIKPVPGRHLCVGKPKDLVAIDKLIDLHGLSNHLSIMETNDSREKKPREKFRSLSASKVHPNNNAGRTSRVHRERDSDFEISVSSYSSVPTTKRRSWNGREISAVLKQGRKPTCRSRSACVSPVRSAGYDSCSEDNPNSKTKVKDIGVTPQSVKTSNKNKISISTKHSEKSSDSEAMLTLDNDKKREDTKILWSSLPSILVNHGKEVLRHKEAALTAAVEALQEASAAERILKCLSTYSELQSAKGGNQQPSVDTFFSLQDNLNQTSLIVQSLRCISPLRDNDSDPCSSGSISEALKLASDRKKNAISWVKQALASDLSPSYSSPSSISMQSEETMRKSSTNSGNKPKGMCFVGMQRNNREVQIGLATDYSIPDWMKGSTIDAAADLTNTLQEECRKWFLAHVENYLDDVKSKTMSKSDSEVAEMMRQMKRVNDWLDVMDGSQEGSTLENSELEAYGRVRNKIYGFLLKNVERTCMALESVNATVE
ncbi:DNA double-strand break repair Rad50 ATPase [Quillaja saponaria]|uniref:DNA double-strand break repair Rad50 ATPase n=1 Tax=Quillaja saponaria TaxID=32244 RepID=A0AAD7KUA8_QUISA|nr:DNA double-strand break repair Rad50 ATPase [Quillaja saponaria]